MDSGIIEHISLQDTRSIIQQDGKQELKDVVNRTHGTIRSYLYILFSPLFGGEIALGPVKIMMNSDSPQESMAQLQYHLTRPWPLKFEDVQKIYREAYNFYYRFTWTPVEETTKLLFDRRENTLIKRELAANALNVILKYLSNWERLAVPAFRQVAMFLQDSPQLKLSRREFQVSISNAVEKSYAAQPLNGIKEIVRDISTLLARDKEWDGKFISTDIAEMLTDRGLGGYVHAINVEAKLRGESLTGDEWLKAIERLHLMNKEGLLTKAEDIAQLAEQEVSSFTNFLEGL